MQRLKLSAIAMAMAFSLGGAFAQSSGSAQPSGTGGAGTSATGGRSAPAAQPGTGTRNSESKKDDKVAAGDRKFVEKAAGSGMFEVQVSQLATTRAKNPDVKSFAGMLVDHHTKANDELTQLANAKGIELPAAPPRAMRRQIDELGKKKADDFDKDYVKQVGIKDHQKDIKEFEKASKDVKDPELKAWVTKTLPTLKDHLAQAQKLQGGGKGGDASKMGAGGAKTSSAGDASHDTGDHSGASTKTGGGSGANKTGT
jgi:putative membrane protein